MTRTILGLELLKEAAKVRLRRAVMRVNEERIVLFLSMSFLSVITSCFIYQVLGLFFVCPGG